MAQKRNPNFSSYCVVKVLKCKSEVLDPFIDFYNRTELETGNRINTLRTYNGREYVNTKFAKFLSDKGIRHQTSAPPTPEQNGVPERKNRTIIDAAWTMISILMESFGQKPVIRLSIFRIASRISW